MPSARLNSALATHFLLAISSAGGERAFSYPIFKTSLIA